MIDATDTSAQMHHAPLDCFLSGLVRLARTPLERPLEAVPYLLYHNTSGLGPKIEIRGRGPTPSKNKYISYP